MQLRLIEPPNEEPVSLLDAKRHLRIEHDEEDGQIEAWIESARVASENDTKRSYVSQTWELILNKTPKDGIITIPSPATPVQEVLSIMLNDEEVELSNFEVDIYNASILIKTEAQIERVAIRFKAGFGNAEEVPAPLKSAILLRVGHLYLHREAVGSSNLKTTPFAVESLELPYRDVRVR